MKPNIEYVKQEMEHREWTGSQLAMKMGVSRMEVSRLLRGRRVGCNLRRAAATGAFASGHSAEHNGHLY